MKFNIDMSKPYEEIERDIKTYLDHFYSEGKTPSVVLVSQPMYFTMKKYNASLFHTWGNEIEISGIKVYGVIGDVKRPSELVEII